VLLLLGWFACSSSEPPRAIGAQFLWQVSDDRLRHDRHLESL
jgi:hypothetical protein